MTTQWIGLLADHELLDEQREIALLQRVADGRAAQAALDATTNPRERMRLQRVIDDARQARDELVRCNMKLVLSIAHKRSSLVSTLTKEDLAQEGVIGLLRAIDRFDVSTGLRLSTYATWWIRQAIDRAIYDTDAIIRVPVHQRERARRFRSSAAALTDNAAQFVAAMERITQTLSLHAPIAGDGDDCVTLEHVLSSEHDVEHDALASCLRDTLMTAVNDLSARERAMIIARYGLDGSAPRTLEEVGRMFGVTRERVRQIMAAALPRLREAVNGWRTEASAAVDAVTPSARMREAWLALTGAQRAVMRARCVHSRDDAARLLKLAIGTVRALHSGAMRDLAPILADMVDEPQRSALLLLFRDGATFQQAPAALGMSLPEVMRCVAEAHHALRRWLDEHDDPRLAARDMIDTHLMRLHPARRRLVVARYGLDGNAPVSVAQLARSRKLTIARVAALLADAIAPIRAELEALGIVSESERESSPTHLLLAEIDLSAVRAVVHAWDETTRAYMRKRLYVTNRIRSSVPRAARATNLSVGDAWRRERHALASLAPLVACVFTPMQRAAIERCIAIERYDDARGTMRDESYVEAIARIERILRATEELQAGT